MKPQQKKLLLGWELQIEVLSSQIIATIHNLDSSGILWGMRCLQPKVTKLITEGMLITYLIMEVFWRLPVASEANRCFSALISLDRLAILNIVYHFLIFDQQF